MSLYVQYVLKITKHKIAHPYLDCKQYSREGKLQGLHLHPRGLGSLEIQMKIHIKNHPHNLPAIIHPSPNNNIHGTGQTGLHKIPLLNLGTRDGGIQTLEVTNSSMQYQCPRTHTRSILQTCNNYFLVLLHLRYHPFHKTLSSLRIHHVLPFWPLNPFQILTTDHPYHFIMLISRIIHLTT